MIKLGLIGFPLEHSFSPSYFKQKFETLKLTDYSYDAFPIEDINKLPELLSAQPELIGLNVTTPYKQAVLPYLDNISSEAKSIGAVNTLKLTPSGLAGFNTDYWGFQKCLASVSNTSQALVLGNGGASQAVQAVLKDQKIPFTLVSRNAGIAYTELSQELVEQAPLIINTTSLGMYPKVEACPDIPYVAIGKGHHLIDLVYNPKKTRFLALGQSQGAQIMNGYAMLVEQAEASWSIWTKED